MKHIIALIALLCSFGANASANWFTSEDGDVSVYRNWRNGTCQIVMGHRLNAALVYESGKLYGLKHDMKAKKTMIAYGNTQAILSSDNDFDELFDQETIEIATIDQHGRTASEIVSLQGLHEATRYYGDCVHTYIK